MRATVHLATDRDARTLRQIVQPVLARVFESTPWARSLEGIARNELIGAGREALARPHTRAQLGRRLAERWPGRDPLALAYAVTCLVPAVQVPPRGIWGSRGQATWVTADAWLDAEPAEAPVEEVVLRYMAAFGPATAADLATWSGLTRTRELLERLGPSLRTFRDDQGRTLYDVEDGPLPDPETPAPPRFLPEYDNVYYAYADRSRVADSRRSPPLAPGNGAQTGTVLVDGFLAAVWKLVRTGGEARIQIEPWEPLARADARAVHAEAEGLTAFLARR